MSILGDIMVLCGYVVGMIHTRARVTRHSWSECNRTGQLRRRSGNLSRWTRYICAVMFVVATVAAGPIDSAGRTVRVGVYQNEPKVFMDENGHASGFFVDLLEEIAAREGWTLVYVPCEWVEKATSCPPL